MTWVNTWSRKPPTGCGQCDRLVPLFALGQVPVRQALGRWTKTKSQAKGGNKRQAQEKGADTCWVQVTGQRISLFNNFARRLHRPELQEAPPVGRWQVEWTHRTSVAATSFVFGFKIKIKICIFDGVWDSVLCQCVVVVVVVVEDVKFRESPETKKHGPHTPLLPFRRFDPDRFRYVTLSLKFLKIDGIFFKNQIRNMQMSAWTG